VSDKLPEGELRMGDAVELGLDFSPISPVVMLQWRRSLPAKKSSARDHPSRCAMAARLGVTGKMVERWESRGPRSAFTALIREHWEHDDPISPINASVVELRRVMGLVGGRSALVSQLDVTKRQFYNWLSGGIVPSQQGWGRLIRNLAIDFGVHDE